ncbi:hypothetical protein [Streptomyces sp. AA1529]|uniref:hypothetical protein n=1 Tax=Streptomyces sp. AA1529 TaxID=1203257 RepID=UPI000684AC9E
MPAEGVDEVTLTTYETVAKRWKHGWELHIDGVGVTQSRTLLDAEPMVRDYVAMILNAPDDSFDVKVTPEIGAGVDGEILGLRHADEELEAARERAGKQRRKVARRLDSLGLSGREIAAILEVSPQRVSQLLGRGKTKTAASKRRSVRRTSKL